jgi:hypothetical protein
LPKLKIPVLRGRDRSASHLLSPSFHFCNIMAQIDIKEASAEWRKKYPTCDQQAEFFLLKFAKDDVNRDKVFTMMKQFRKFDSRSQGELEEDEAMRLLESRNETKTFKELREMVADIDLDKNRKLSFLEWACAIFKKSWVTLHTPSVDPEEVRRAEELAATAYAEAAEKKAREDRARELEDEKRLAELKAASERAAAEQSVEAAKAAKAALEAEILRQQQDRKRRDEEERREQERREEEARKLREKELNQAGVAGKAAIFKYAAQDARDPTQNNEARIKAEAAKRRAEKEAKENAEADKKRAAEEAENARLQHEEAAARQAKAAEDARRAAEERARAEAERLAAEAKQAEADAERQKALAGSEAERKQRELYEEAKRQEEEKARKKKEEEEARRAAGRAKIAARAAAWNNNSSTQVIKEVERGGVVLNKAATKESSTLTTARLQGQIKKGAELKHVQKPSTELTDTQKQAFLEDRS